MRGVQDFPGEFAAERDLLRSIVSLHEDRLLQQGSAFLSGYPLPYIHQSIRHFALRLVQQDDVHLPLEKSVGTQQRLQLSVGIQDGAVKRLGLALWEEANSAERFRLSFGVELLAIMHHGVKELFGLVSDPQRVQEPDIFVMRRDMLLNHSHYQLWRGLRWLCTNLLVLDDSMWGGSSNGIKLKRE